MKIQGPGGTKPPTVEGVEKAEAPGTGFIDKVEGKTPAAAAGATGKTDPIGALAAQLKSGEITPQQALQKLLDLSTTVLAHVPEAARGQLRAQLEAMVHEDPFLAAKAKRLGLPGEE